MVSLLTIASPAPTLSVQSEGLLLPQRFTTALQNRQLTRLFVIQQKIKRGFDVVVAVTGLFLASFILLFIAVLIKLTSQGPAFYLSERIGYQQKKFYMIKFRTMFVGADAQRQQLVDSMGEQNTLFKMKDDPRVTPLGRFLRKSSLDELPQLFNVLKGEMSLVGPRPYIEEESNLFAGNALHRFQVLPGMTGPWQVSGRSSLNFNDLCRIELLYLNRWSLFEDLKVLFKTIPVVLNAKGAY